MPTGPIPAPTQDGHGENWDTWRGRVNLALEDLAEQRKILMRILKAVAGGTEDDEIGLREGHRDHERRIAALEGRAQAGRVWWRDVALGLIGASGLATLEALLARFHHG